MKVYIIEAYDYDMHENIGVYSTEEKAEMEKEKLHKKKAYGMLMYPKRGSVGLSVQEYEVE